jgi:uncharacterized membrane protein
MNRTLQPVPRWAIYASWLLSFIGVALAIYLTIAHYHGSKILACPDTGTINCAKVTTSAQSVFLGMPVAVLGLATFVVMVAINSPWAWKSRWYWLHVVRFVLVLGSMAFVLWLVYAEIIIIGNICLYCTGVHLTTFALLIVVTRVVPTQLGWIRSTTE